MAMVHCRACGKEIHETAPTCPHCGAVQFGATNGKSLKSQTVAGLWCTFLGGFGAHRFYLGKTVTAVFYLIFFWTSIPGLIACVELLLIAFSDPQKWANKYNGGILTPPTHWAVKVLAIIGPIVFVVSLLAAIALPAYHDYAERARAAQMR